MAMTAQQYLETLPISEQNAVNKYLQESGSSIEEWYRDTIAPGNPRAVEPPGGAADSYSAEEGGPIAAWQGAAPSSEWLGKRKPTTQELRKWAHETGRSEDYERFQDATVSGWIERNWDIRAGIFKNNYGDSVDKPDERGPRTPPGVNGTGDKGDYGDGGGGGAGPAVPTGPTTQGKPGHMSYTGNPLTDMLIYQFNNRRQLGNTSQPNIFAQLDDRTAGKAGEKAPDIRGQLLPGGGLWWTPEAGAAETFKGFGEGGLQSRRPPAPTPAPAYLYDPLPASTPAPEGTPIQRMLRKQQRRGDFGGEYLRPFTI